MQIIIHRGSHQIGGCATEIKTAGARIIIDFGAPLDGSFEQLMIDGVTNASEKCDAVFFTHYHGDHVGLLDSIEKRVPTYIGELSKQILLLSNQRREIYNNERLKLLNTFKAGEAIVLGDMKITPFSVDHSAFDSYMFLIEAEGKRVLHTGDFRAHGFRGKGLRKVIDKYVGKVDALICEGTMLGRSSEKSMTEYELSQKAGELFKENKHIFVVCASTNIDRIAAFYSAVPRGFRCVCDEYQRSILELAEENAGKYTSLYQFPKILTYGKNLDEKMEKYGFCMFVRLGNPSHLKIMERYKEKNPLVIYSMWQGYLEDERTSDFLKDFRTEKLHTGGHADFAALSELIKKTAPELIIPIHTESPERLQELCGTSRVLAVEDKESVSL